MLADIDGQEGEDHAAADGAYEQAAQDEPELGAVFVLGGEESFQHDGRHLGAGSDLSPGQAGRHVPIVMLVAVTDHERSANDVLIGALLKRRGPESGEKDSTSL